MEPTRTSVQSIGLEQAERLQAVIMSHIFIEDRGYAAPCWRSTRAVRKDGFTATSLDGRNWQTHRLAYMLFVGEIPPLMQVRHKCGLSTCCRYSAQVDFEEDVRADARGIRGDVGPPGWCLRHLWGNQCIQKRQVITCRPLPRNRAGPRNPLPLVQRVAGGIR